MFETAAELVLIRSVKACAALLVGFSIFALAGILSQSSPSGTAAVYVIEYAGLVAAYLAVYVWIKDGLDNPLKWLLAMIALLPPLSLIVGWKLLPQI
jgi:hypothetical protein